MEPPVLSIKLLLPWRSAHSTECPVKQVRERHTHTHTHTHTPRSRSEGEMGEFSLKKGSMSESVETAAVTTASDVKFLTHTHPSCQLYMLKHLHRPPNIYTQ